MKTIKTGFGVMKIEDCEEDALIHQLREILTTHRSALIQRLSSDLPVYLEYLFHVKVDKKQLEEIKDRLSQLKNASIDIDKYNSVVQLVIKQDVTHVTNEIFYQELNECIGSHLYEPPLKFVS